MDQDGGVEQCNTVLQHRCHGARACDPWGVFRAANSDELSVPQVQMWQLLLGFKPESKPI